MVHRCGLYNVECAKSLNFVTSVLQSVYLWCAKFDETIFHIRQDSDRSACSHLQSTQHRSMPCEYGWEEPFSYFKSILSGWMKRLINWCWVGRMKCYVDTMVPWIMNAQFLLEFQQAYAGRTLLRNGWISCSTFPTLMTEASQLNWLSNALTLL